jgi:hypothetical protein
MDGNKEKNLYFSFFEIYCGDDMIPYDNDAIRNSKLIFREETLVYNGKIIDLTELYFSGSEEKTKTYLKEWASKKFNLNINFVL